MSGLIVERETADPPGARFEIEIVWADGTRETRVHRSTFEASQMAYADRFGLGSPPAVYIEQANVLGRVA